MIEDENFTPCESCIQPDSCITRCGIQEYINQNTNIAEQRGETPEQLFGDAK